MEEISFFAVDIFIILAIFLSFIVGWARGATKEILSVVSWVGGIYITVSLFPYAKDFTRSYISHGLIADFVTSCAIFILFLTILSMFNYFCSNLVKKSVLNTTDKALGGMFGIARGVIILAILELFINQCIFSETPKCVENSKLRPTISSVSNFIVLVLPESIQDKVLSHMSKIKKQNLLDFVKEDIIEAVAPESVDNIIEESSKVIATKDHNHELKGNNDYGVEDEVIEEAEEHLVKNSPQTAEDLATLKPKRSGESSKKTLDKSVVKKGRKDMDRILDQYDDVDEQ